MADPGLSKPKLVLGVLLWLWSVAAAILPAVVVYLVDEPGGPLADHARATGALVVAGGLAGLAAGARALRGQRLPGVALWVPALVPWVFASAFGAWGAYEAMFGRLFPFHALLAHGAHASGGLLFAAGLVGALALLRALPASRRETGAARWAVGAAIVIGSAPVFLKLRGSFAHLSVHEHDSFVFFAPAWLLSGALVLALRRRDVASEDQRRLGRAFLLALSAPLLFGFASVVGSLGSVEQVLSSSQPLPDAISALRSSCVAFGCHLIAALLFSAAAFGALPAPRVSVWSRAGAAVGLAAAVASAFFVWKLDARCGYELFLARQGPLSSPLKMALSRRLPAPLPPAVPEPSRPVYPYALPLEPEGAPVEVPTDADRLMAEAREAPPAVPELPKELPEPMARFERECAEGNGQSCANLAFLVSDQDVSRAPLVLAASLLERGCRAGSELACGRQGQALIRGWGVLQDAARGLELLDKACRAGSFDACGRLGTELSWGRHVAPDWERGRRLLTDACAKQVSHACAVLARTTPSQFLSDLERKDLDAQARKAAAGACMNDDVEACGFLEYATPANIPGGISVYDVARLRQLGWLQCQKELPLTCELERMASDPRGACRRGLGSQCDGGRMGTSVLAAGCRTGSLRACASWVESAKQGSAERKRRVTEACQLGQVRYCAEGREASSAEDVRALESACPSVSLSSSRSELDDSACEAAARAHQQGKVVPRNIGRALELYRRGCWDNPRYPNHAACVAMADIFLSGDGVARDFSRAMQIFASDCEVYGKESCKRVADLLERTAPDDEREERKRWREHFRRRSQ